MHSLSSDLSVPGMAGDPDISGLSLASSSMRVASESGATVQFCNPVSVVISACGALIVADTENHCIRKITHNGARIRPKTLRLVSELAINFEVIFNKSNSYKKPHL
jgi:hypothetical protein